MSGVKSAAVAFICAFSLVLGLAAAPSASAASAPASALMAGTPVAPTSPKAPRSAFRVFREIIKRVPQLVSVAKKGWDAFKKFWDANVPWWVKALLFGYNLYDLYTWIRQNFG